MNTMFSIGFMTWGAEGGLAKGFSQVRDGWYGFWCGCGAGTGAVRGRYGKMAYCPTSKNANRALLLKLAKYPGYYLNLSSRL